MRRAITVCGALAVLAFGASAVPVFGADNGTVNAQVSVAAAPAACITVPATTVDFGTQAFNGAGQTTQDSGSAITVSSCSTGVQSLLARGTSAVGPQATWTLTTTPVCAATPVTNEYNLGRILAGGFSALGLTNSTLTSSLAVGGSFTITPVLRMPCVGSGGAGTTMSMSYVFTATIP
jgi:hypothetical protein